MKITEITAGSSSLLVLVYVCVLVFARLKMFMEILYAF